MDETAFYAKHRVWPKENPWRRPFLLILIWNICFFVPTFNVYLDLVIKMAGAVCFCLGTRGLRNENKDFQALWVAALCYMGLVALYIVSLATGWWPQMQPHVLLLPNGNFYIIILLAIDGAIRKVYKTGPTFMGWDGLLCAGLALFAVQILQIGSAPYFNFQWLIWCIRAIVLYEIYDKGCHLAKIQTALNTTPCKPPPAAVAAGYGALCLVLAVVANVVVLRGAPRFILQPEGGEPQIEQRLQKLGFPQAVLQDLSKSTLLALQHAQAVTVEPASATSTPRAAAHPGQGLDSQIIYVELPGNKFCAIVHFAWNDPSKRFWEDGLRVESRGKYGLVDGRLLYTKQSVDYSATMPKLSYGLVESNYGQSTHVEAITAAVNFPDNVQNQRGYVAYMGSIWGGVGTRFYYYHAPPGLRLPYVEAYQKILATKEQEGLLVQAARYP